MQLNGDMLHFIDNLTQEKYNVEISLNFKHKSLVQ